MSNELIVSSSQNGSRIALLRDKQLIEFHEEDEGTKFKVGDIFLGSVNKVVQGLNAAFVDVGYEKDAFLHYFDLGPQFKSLSKFTHFALTRKNTTGNLSKFKLEKDIDKLGKIGQVLSRNDKILVQVVKEPISTKGPRLSTEISIAGRYLILTPFSNSINISKRISNREERKRLNRLVTSIKPDNFGVIIRTVAEGKEVAELDRDLRNLVDSWNEGVKRLKKAKPKDKIIGEMNRASSLLRDVLNESFDNITVDDPAAFEEIKSYIRQYAPDKEKIVKLYKGKVRIFEHYNIEKQLKILFGQTVSVKGGGYLVIEHTEALHVIDVNSGNKSAREDNQEQTALSTNIEAAKEVARQLRLRDMGGIIVVDFIDMRTTSNRKEIYRIMKEEMASDRSKNTVLPLSKFGLMQITRQRVRPEMNIKTGEACPTCGGTGKIGPSIQVSEEIEKGVDLLMTSQNISNIALSLHPYLYSYFTKGLISKQKKWFFKYHKWINLVEDTSLPITEYHFIDQNGEDIEMN